MDLSKMKTDAENLLKLLDEPQEDLVTWNQCLALVLFSLSHEIVKYFYGDDKVEKGKADVEN